MASLEVKDLTVRLGDPKRTVLSSLSFGVYDPSVVLLLGANGSGKSVLLRTILGLHPLTKGTLHVDGTAVRDFRTQVHRRSGIALQNPDHQIFGDTVGDDLSIGLAGKVAPNHPAIQAMGLTDILDLPPHELSGGQRRRLALAGACMAARDFLFLDEPFIELDFPHILRLIDLITSARSAGTTVVVASHETRDIWEISDRVLLLHEGKPMAYGPPEEVLPAITVETGLRPRAVEGPSV
jgi:energy-coupling factor transporter ATP-binding protein EcfA2